MDAAEVRIPVDEKTELRLLEEGDAPTLFAAVVTNREHLRRFLPFVDHTKEVGFTRKFITDELDRFVKGESMQLGLWHIGRLVGGLGTVRINEEHASAEIGYWIEEDLQGTGLMCSAIGAFLDHLVEARGLNRIVIRCVVDNGRSRALAERLGFTFEGVERQAFRLRGEFHDLMMYSLLVQEWRESRDAGAQ